MDLDERRVLDRAAALDDVEHVDVLGERRAGGDAHQRGEPRRGRALGVAQVSLADFPALRREHGADRAARDDRGMLGAHGGIDARRIAHDRKRPAGPLAGGAAVEVRYAHRLVLLEHLDAVAAEGRRNPLAVQRLPGRRLAEGRRLNQERNGGNI